MQRRPFLFASALAAVLPAPRVFANTPQLVLGHTGILGGPLGGPVKAMLAGAQLAFNDANAKGGVGGRQIKVVSLDDELKPDKAVANYKKLLTEHDAFAFFGCVGSGTTAAAASVLKESGAPMVGGYAVSDSARDKTRGSGYYIRATSGREAEALVQHLTTIGLTRIAVAQLDNPGGVEIQKLIEAALQARKLKTIAAAPIKGDGSNVAEASKILSDAKPQAVLMYLGGALGGDVMKAMWAQGSNPSFYGMSIVPGDLIAKKLGDQTRGLAISQIVPYPWNEANGQVNEYRRLATAAKAPLGYYTFEGYANALVMLDALKRMGGKEPSRARLHAALRATRMRVSNMEIDFTDGRHTGSRFIELVSVTKEGRFLR